MRMLTALAAAGLFTLSAAPALAQDAMSAPMMSTPMAATMGMMQKGEVMSFMPDGHMGKAMMTDATMMDMMMTMAKPIEHCLIILTGMDGKTYLIQPMTPEGIAKCEKMSM